MHHVLPAGQYQPLPFFYCRQPSFRRRSQLKLLLPAAELHLQLNCVNSFLFITTILPFYKILLTAWQFQTEIIVILTSIIRKTKLIAISSAAFSAQQQPAFNLPYQQLVKRKPRQYFHTPKTQYQHQNEQQRIKSQHRRRDLQQRQQILSTQIHKKDMDKKNTERIIAQIQHNRFCKGIFSINILRMIKSIAIKIVYKNILSGKQINSKI